MTGRIRTTHIGSLPRPDDLVLLLRQNDEGGVIDRAGFDARVRSAVEDVVRKQQATGLDIVNDGEQGKPDYSTYIKDRFTGFEGESATMPMGATSRTSPISRRGLGRRPPSGGRPVPGPSRGKTSARSRRTSRTSSARPSGPGPATLS